MTDHESNMLPRRRSPRVAATGISAFLGLDERTAGAPGALSLLNISESGLAVLARAPIGDIDDAFTLRLQAPRGITVRCRCAIRYVLGGKHEPGELPHWLHGAEFVSLEDAAARFLEAFVLAQRLRPVAR